MAWRWWNQDSKPDLPCSEFYSHVLYTKASPVAQWYIIHLQSRRCRRHRFDPWVGKIPWRRKWQLTPAFLPGKSHGQRSLVGYSPWSHKESDMTEQLTLFTFLSLYYLLSRCLIIKKSNSAFFPQCIYSISFY